MNRVILQSWRGKLWISARRGEIREEWRGPGRPAEAGRLETMRGMCNYDRQPAGLAASERRVKLSEATVKQASDPTKKNDGTNERGA